MAANGMGLLIKPKGRTSAELIEADSIEQVVIVPNKPKQIKSKSLKVVTLEDARSHLAERHGTSLAWINTATDQSALEYHKTLDHSDLGHNHDPKPVKDESPAESTEAPVEA
jgi:hypothetical protein